MTSSYRLEWRFVLETPKDPNSLAGDWESGEVFDDVQKAMRAANVLPIAGVRQYQATVYHEPVKVKDVITCPVTNAALPLIEFFCPECDTIAKGLKQRSIIKCSECKKPMLPFQQFK